MKVKMDINIIIPTYKPGNYLYECLQAIDKQDIDLSLFKVTIVLNGSREPYYGQIKKWLSCFKFTSELLYSDIASVSHARNIALDKSESLYISFLDDDDIISNNYLSSLVSGIQPNSIVVSNTYNFFNDLNLTKKDYLTFNEKFSSDNLVKYRKYLSNSCCKLIPRSLIGDTRFILDLKRSEDAVFMFSLSNKIEKIISTDNNAIYYRRLRLNSASRMKYRLFIEIRDALNIMTNFSKIYFGNINKYSFLLYLTRLLAVIKRVLLTFR